MPSMDDGIRADTKKGLVQHSGGKPICKYIRPKTKLSKTHINVTILLIFDWQYHPDKQSADVPAGAVEECIQKFIEVDQAWKILGNEETKKEYDLRRHEDDLRNMGPVDAQVYLEEMSWNKDDHSFSLGCRCGGKYIVSKEEAEEVTLVSCDTCSLIIELLHCS